VARGGRQWRPGGSGRRRLIANPATANISTHDCGSSWLAAGARVRSPSLLSAGEVVAMRDGPPWNSFRGANGEGNGVHKMCPHVSWRGFRAELMSAETT
jgi:hypothetical protein